MKAIICTKYGPPEVLKLRIINKPVPKDNEVLVKMHATTVTSGDSRMRSFNVPFLFWLPFRLFLGFTKPRSPILGIDISGEITAIGKDVTRFKIGDKVFGSSYPSGGTYAEFICVPEKSVLTTIPKNATYEQAAAIFFGAHTANHFLRKANIQKGQKVLIYGASGSLGTYAVQLANYYGAQVTGVCSTKNIQLVKSLGAEKVIDYTKEDYTKKGQYDVIFDTVGKSSFSKSLKSLKKKGIYLRAVHLTLGSIIRGIWTNITSKKKVIGGVAGETLEDLKFLKKLVEENKIKPVISKTYLFNQIREAHKHIDGGHKVGNIVIKIK